MAKGGALNSITDVLGIAVGQHTSLDYACGVTVILCPSGAVAGVDVRGAAPGTRETDLLAPHNLVQQVQAVVLTGGSVYGLSTAHGVVRWLAEHKSGFPLDRGHVAPIVPSAALFDLGRGREYVPPIGEDWGYKACESASVGAVRLGCVGAGTGAVAGGIKGGVGAASEVLESGITVAALVAANSLGSVIDPSTGLAWEIDLEIDGEFGLLARRAVKLPDSNRPASPANTTIGVVATDAALTKAEAQKIAQMAHDGLARAVRPAHTMFDGDTLFCLATALRPLPEIVGVFVGPRACSLNEIGRAAADCVSRAIVRAVVEAHSLPGMIALRDMERR